MNRLVRLQKGKKIGGVCVGLAQFLGIDVTIIRIIFVFLALPGGAPGIIPYLILWIVMPSEDRI